MSQNSLNHSQNYRILVSFHLGLTFNMTFVRIIRRNISSYLIVLTLRLMLHFLYRETLINTDFVRVGGKKTSQKELITMPII